MDITIYTYYIFTQPFYQRFSIHAIDSHHFLTQMFLIACLYLSNQKFPVNRSDKQVWHTEISRCQRIGSIQPGMGIVKELHTESTTYNLIELVITDRRFQFLLGGADELLIFLLADDIVERGIALLHGGDEEVEILIGLLDSQRLWDDNWHCILEGSFQSEWCHWVNRFSVFTGDTDADMRLTNLTISVCYRAKCLPFRNALTCLERNVTTQTRYPQLTSVSQAQHNVAVDVLQWNGQSRFFLQFLTRLVESATIVAIGNGLFERGVCIQIQITDSSIHWRDHFRAL